MHKIDGAMLRFFGENDGRKTGGAVTKSHEIKIS